MLAELKYQLINNRVYEGLMKLNLNVIPYKTYI